MPVCSKKDFLILYGSQTGQAEAISEEIFDQAHKQGFNPSRFCLSQVEKKFSIEKTSCVVFVCSTTGEGEPPDTALKFFRRIKKKTLSSRFLSNLTYAFLALGDSNYTNFCACGKGIDQRLKDLGASHFYDTGYADDAVGLEVVVEPWIEGLFPALKSHLNGSVVKVNVDAADEQKLSLENTNNNQNNKLTNVSVMADEKKETHEVNCSTEASLRYSISPLCSSALKIPSSPDAFLKIVQNDSKGDKSFIVHPSSASVVKEVTIDNARYLTSDDLVKTTMEIELDIANTLFTYQPGDSFGIICENKKEHVDYLLQRLQSEDTSDNNISFEILHDTKKKAPKIPSHLHYPSTLREVLTKNVDFCAVPRKAFLRMLVVYTEDDSERRRLQELCSTQGSKDYGLFIREQLIGLIELLKTFKSCHPPIERVLELLPGLLPREYSVACSPHLYPNSLKFVFNIIKHPEFQGQKRYGLCTRWLQKKCEVFTTAAAAIDEKLKQLTLSKPKISIYMRCPNNFRFPQDASRPLIMIGPGTGVAPYLGFLQHRDYIKNEIKGQLGEAILFFGCRYSEKDFLYRHELETYLKSGVLSNLFTSFSRDTKVDLNQTRYVQENIKKHKEIVLRLIFKEKGAVYICGDAKHMGRDVTNTFVELIEEYKQISKMDAITVLAELRNEKQFLEDVWT